MGPVQRFGDGYQITCRKTGENDRPLRDWLHESQRSIRTTRYWLLDERTRIAGCHMIRDLVLDLIREVGIDNYMRFAYEIVEDGRRSLIRRIKSMTVPGKYRAVAFVDVGYKHPDVQVPPYAKVDTIMHAPHEITIHPDGTWKLDFEGSSRWGWHSFNAQPVSFTSGIWVMMTQTLIPTELVNDGAYYATQFRLPRGTWQNPDDRRTATRTLGTSWFPPGAPSGEASARPTLPAGISKKSTPATPTRPTGSKAAGSTSTTRFTPSTALRRLPRGREPVR